MLLSGTYPLKAWFVVICSSHTLAHYSGAVCEEGTWKPHSEVEEGRWVAADFSKASDADLLLFE